MPRRSLGLVLPCFARLVTCAVHTGCVRSLYHVQRKESRYVLCCQLVASKLVLCSTPFIRCPCTATEMTDTRLRTALDLSLIHISEPTRLGMISYAVFCLKKKKKKR